MSTTASFGRWLSARRHLLDLTQEELARRVGCSVVTIRKLEADERRPSKQIAERLADCLEIAQDDRPGFLRLARADPSTIAEARFSIAVPASDANAPIRRTNLTAPLTPLIGREQDVAAARTRLLQPQERLLTLIGPPGIGKTRLAIAVANEVLNAFPDGVYFVALAPIGTPNLVATSIAQTLGLRERGDAPPLAQLKDYLREKRMVLLLDNFEHVVDAAPEVVELLIECPALKVLVTSRAALQVRGEQLFPVPPLLLPDVACLPLTDALAHVPAVALFVQRAQAARPDFDLTDENAQAVATLCTRLDGLPLAIELIAARVRLLPPQALLARLNSALTLLTDGPHDLAPRYRTLRGAIGWSYELLGPEEQLLFRRLGVFVGGCSLATAEAVLSDDRWEPHETGRLIPSIVVNQVLGGLASLVNKSLIKQMEGLDGESRFVMLETIHEYAREQLMASCEADIMRRRHAAFFVELVELAEPELRGSQQVAWLTRLEVEYPNLRAVVECALERGNADHLARLVNALELFWIKRGHLAEGRQWAESALARSNRAAPMVVDVRLLRTAMLIAWMQGDMVAAREWGAEGLSAAQHVGDASNLALALSWLGWMEFYVENYQDAYALLEEGAQVARAGRDFWTRGVALALFGHEVLKRRGNVTAACDLFEESAALFQRMGDIHFLSFAREFLGHASLYRGHPEEARTHYQEALTMRRFLNDRLSIGWALYNLGQAEFAVNSLERAARCFEESLTLFQDLGTRLNVVPELIRWLGTVARQAGDIRQAKARFLDSLIRFQAIHDTPGIIRCLVGLGGVAAGHGHAVQGLRLLCAADRHIQTSGMEAEVALQTALDHARRVACSQLDATAVEAECAAGGELSLEQAAAEALAG